MEPDMPGQVKAEQDVNCVDLVVSLLKQLLEVPNGRAAQASADARAALACLCPRSLAPLRARRARA